MARKRNLFHDSDQSFLKFKSWILIFLLSVFLSLNSSPVFSHSTEIKKLQEQIQAHYQSDFTQVNDAFNQLIEIYTNQGSKGQHNLAITWTNLGYFQYRLGQIKLALKSWEKAANIYQNLQLTNQSTQVRTFQAQALQELGLFPQACAILGENLELQSKICQGQINQAIIDEQILPKIQKDKTLNTSLQNLGQIFQRTGRLKEAKLLLETTLRIEPNSTGSWLSLGNTFQAMGNLERDRQSLTKINPNRWQCNLINLDNLPIETQEQVTQYYHQSLEAYTQALKNANPSLQQKIKLNQLNLLLVSGNITSAKTLSNEINLEKLPIGYSRVYARINYAKSQSCLNPDWNSIIDLLNVALTEAQTINNLQLESYVLGNLGGVYEVLSLNDQQWQPKALDLTQKALYLAQDFPHIAYQWLWQLGRLYQAQGNKKEAITNYELAIQSLEKVRQDLLAVNSDVQFSFRDNVEPLYRQLVNLILSSDNQPPNPKVLEQSLNYIESLQLAELENFLRCNLTTNIQVNQISDPTTAIIYPIILSDRLAIIIKLPQAEQALLYVETPVKQQEIETTLSHLQNYLRESGNTPEILIEASKIYQWLIKPLETTLQNNPQIDTLAFILDGELRNIPIAVLYDGEKYLIEKNYAIAVVPGLTLFRPQLSQSPLKVFTGGVEVPQVFSDNLQFGPIEQLRQELSQISQKVNTSQPLLNEQFTKTNIQKELESGKFTAIHWKTHGVFSSDPENTFIVAYQDKITANDLNQFLQTGSKNQTQPLELLVLSACETAQGDNRAVLGLAGLAVRAGSKSTLSTLWRANDAANTLLMTRFYTELTQPKMTKAKALQQAQLALFKEYGYLDPHFWSTYVLVGNWL